MNKAFCREPESGPAPLCPACGGTGAAVGADTLAAHAPVGLGDPAYFCTTETCDVAYFDEVGRTVAASAATGLYWPKDPAGPLCSCHGLTADDVDGEIVAGDPRRLREVLRLAAEPDAACGLASADGRPCTARLQRYFLRRRRELGG